MHTNQTPTLRVSSGTAKNKKLSVPADIPNFRPVQEVVKQAIFAIIAGKITGARCLDLFAGSGNLGIEALSRGADWCDFVDESVTAKETVEKNLFECGFTNSAEVVRKNALKYCAHAVNEHKTYAIIFLDPFYDDTAQKHLLKQLPSLLAKNGIIVYLYGKNLDLQTVIKDTPLKIETTRNFGASHFWVLR